MIESFEYLEYALKNSPLSDVRRRQWEKLYPGCTHEFGEIFDTEMPTPEAVASWKMGWVEKTPNYMVMEDAQPSDLVVTPGIKEEIHQTCHRLGIHPYFWDYWVHREARWYPDTNRTEHNVEPRVSFYTAEQLVMFKLAWRNE